MPAWIPSACRRLSRLVLVSITLATAVVGPGSVRAGVLFCNCVHAADGSITCDTVPTGNTLMNDVDARYGLLQNASPGWNEFSPYQGFNQELGGGFD